MSRSSVAALLAMALLVAVVAPAAAQSCTTNADCGGTQPACVDFFGELTCSSECARFGLVGLVGACPHTLYPHPQHTRLQVATVTKPTPCAPKVAMAPPLCAAPTEPAVLALTCLPRPARARTLAETAFPVAHAVRQQLLGRSSHSARALTWL